MVETDKNDELNLTNSVTEIKKALKSLNATINKLQSVESNHLNAINNFNVVKRAQIEFKTGIFACYGIHSLDEKINQLKDQFTIIFELDTIIFQPIERKK